MKQQLILILAAAAVTLGGAACNKVERIDLKTVRPHEQNPALWAEYLAALSAYKASEHYLTYALMENAPEVSTSPKDFMNILPDSLDFVALTRPLSPYDVQDLPEVRAKGTKVLMRADCTDADGAQTLAAALAQIATYDLDGLVVASAAPDAATAAAIAELPVGKALIFEGNPALLPEAERPRYDYYLFDTSSINNLFTLRDQIDYLVERLGIPARKLLLATTPTDKIDDTSLRAQPALAAIARSVLAYGPLGGLAVNEVQDDYYDPNIAYPRTKEAIAIMNPTAN